MLRRGFPGSGSVYAAAQRTVEAQPCNAAAHAALGLACEARGAWSDAAHALGTAVELAQENLTNGGQGLRSLHMRACQPPTCGEEAAATGVQCKRHWELTLRGHSSSAVLMLRHKHIPLAGLACNCNQRLALKRLQGS